MLELGHGRFDQLQSIVAAVVAITSLATIVAITSFIATSGGG
jgi:hypothetical protein